jgi:membrane protease YdiL (CAAX protease family)
MTNHLLSPDHLRFSIAVLWCIVGFSGYYFLSRNRTSKRWFGIPFRCLDEQGNQVIMQRFLGLMFLGVFSALIISLLPGFKLRESGLSLHFHSAPPWWYWLLFPVIPPLGYFATRKKGSIERYPQIRAKIWTPRMILLNSVSWLLFLIGYEFLFRGFLLHASLGLLEPVPAIALNCTLYSLAHLYKGPVETLGAIPVGILFCYITLVTGNIWCAVALHTVMALSNEWFALRAHPEMKLMKVT